MGLCLKVCILSLSDEYGLHHSFISIDPAVIVQSVALKIEYIYEF